MSATTPIRDQDTRAPAPAMKWWGWGEQSIEFTHEDKPGLAPFIREVLGIDVTRSGTALPAFEALDVPEPRLPAELRDKNPTGSMWRNIDGKWTQGDVPPKA